MNWGDPHLKRELTTCLTENKPTLGDEKRRKIVNALQKTTYAVKNSLDVSAVKLGYELSGQYPLNFEAAMRETCKRRTISDNDYNIMKNSVDQLVQIYQTKGFVAEKDMDGLNIPNFNDECYSSVPKEQRSLHQQRAVVMNADELIQHLKSLKHKKLEAEQQRKRNAELREAKKKAGAQEKLDYDNWFKSLSPTEAARERQRIREANRKSRLDAFQPPAEQQAAVN